MRWVQVTVTAVVAAGLVGSAPTEAVDMSGVGSPAMQALGAAPQEAGVTLLSYNVEGLPWPAARGRSTAAQAIARDLRLLRQQGLAPQVVAIQEGFRAADKRIGREAGYRYSAFGPSVEDKGGAPETAEDQRFVAKASLFSGETLGKHVDSGLAIFSDYPILWVKSRAFPAYACAGWDCMANKGMLAVAIQVPGHDGPVVVLDTHLNARTAAHTAVGRPAYAFQRQVDLLGRFIDEVAPAGTPMMLAGDFNVGRDPGRRAYMGEHLFGETGLQVAAAEHDCGRDCRAASVATASLDTTLRKAKSMLIVRAPAAASATGAIGVFGREGNGAMLSDHIGIAMRFDFSASRLAEVGKLPAPRG
jgi:endonuclease/exonuclease/phosphatase family metal-dependent hydrolase